MSVQADIDPELESELSACRDIAGALEPQIETAELSRMRKGLDASLAQERGLLASLRARPTSQRIALMMAVTLLVVVVSLMATPRSDLASYPIARMVGVLAVLGGVTSAAAWRLLRPLHLPRPSVASDRLLLVLGVLAPVIAALWPMHAHLGAHPGEGGTFIARCAGCMAFGASMGLPILLLAFALRRARVDGPAVAALAGVSAGIGGNLALQVHCPITATSHLMGGHAMLVVILGVAAALWRR